MTRVTPTCDNQGSQELYALLCRDDIAFYVLLYKTV
jgi:hypothetical protein